jgi:hypothetical protein
VLYNHACSSSINECLLGTNSTFWIIGASESGKKYTLRGGDHEDKGIVISAIENILNLFEM